MHACALQVRRLPFVTPSLILTRQLTHPYFLPMCAVGDRDRVRLHTVEYETAGSAGTVLPYCLEGWESRILRLEGGECVSVPERRQRGSAFASRLEVLIAFGQGQRTCMAGGDARRVDTSL